MVYDHDASAVATLRQDGAIGAADVDKLVKQLAPPRAVWLMLPAGKITENTIDQLAELLAPGDMIIDGGNRFWKDDVRRGKKLKERLSAMRKGFGAHVDQKTVRPNRHDFEDGRYKGARRRSLFAWSFSARSGVLPTGLLVPALYNLAAASACCRRPFSLIDGVRAVPSYIKAKRFPSGPRPRASPQFANRIDRYKTSSHQVLGYSRVMMQERPPTTNPGLMRIFNGSSTRVERQKRATNRAIGCFIWQHPRGGVRSPLLSCHLGQSGLARENGAWRRVIIEKPFGRDLDSLRVRSIQELLRQVFKERQIFRIDHYLGRRRCRTSCRCVLPMAYSSRSEIATTSIMCKSPLPKSLTVGRRGNYYDATGALRDMVPNHLIQLLSLIAMEPPSRFTARTPCGRRRRNCSRPSSCRTAPRPCAIR